jgi:hypothetical protein
MEQREIILRQQLGKHGYKLKVQMKDSLSKVHIQTR